ncbi:MAG: TOTE conflict system archaeo-eukaryotic primase domain-containing protein [Promethearchaeota archaeon]
MTSTGAEIPEDLRFAGITPSLRRSVELFLGLFKGLEGIHSIQVKDGSYRPVHYALRPYDIHRHFIGDKTLGLYLLDIYDRVSVMVIDIDIAKGVFETSRVWKACQDDVRAQSKHLRDLGIPNYIEFSGRRGYHIWIFLEESIPGEYARKFGNKVVFEASKEILGTRSSNGGGEKEQDRRHEFFPKQAKKGRLGNLIKLPLGVHRPVKKLYEEALDVLPDVLPEDATEDELIDADLLDYLDAIQEREDERYRRAMDDWNASSGVDKSKGSKPVRRNFLSLRYYREGKLALKDGRMYFVDPESLLPFIGQHELLSSIQRTPKERIEAIIGEQIPALERVELAPRRMRDAPTRSISVDLHPEGIPESKIEVMEAFLTGNVVSTPPCIAEAYRRATEERGEWYTRNLVARYLKALGFTVDEIAALFQRRVNDAEQNANEWELHRQLEYAWRLENFEGCGALKNRELCVNWNFQRPSGDVVNIINELERIQEAPRVLAEIGRVGGASGYSVRCTRFTSPMRNIESEARWNGSNYSASNRKRKPASSYKTRTVSS